MFTTALLAVASLIGDVTATPGTMAMKFSRSQPKNQIVKRDPTSVAVGNAQSIGLYYVNATVGTPGQEIVLQIDTGSSDVWMFNPDACSEADCIPEGNAFDSTNSSTYHLLARNLFKIQYVTPGSLVQGDYFRDNFALGDLKLTNLTMALATQAKEVQTGIMGIGFDADESIVSRGGNAYPSIIDEMVNQSIIESHSYSLWLDDSEANSGTILFGGYDTDKYLGQLTVLDIQPDAQSGTISSFTVAWSLLALTDSTGTTAVNGNFPYAAVLDSGTTLMAVPTEVYQPLAGYFGVEDDEDYGPVFPCKYGNWPGTLDFGFGGPNGAIIQVPFSEIAIPTGDSNGDLLRFRNGDEACLFGIQETPQEGTYLLGDTLLRSAYVVYDIDAKQIGIAQTNWNSKSDGNVKAIGSGTALAQLIPSATYVTGVSVTQSETASQLGPFGGRSTHTGSATLGAASASGTLSHIDGQKTSLNVPSLTQTPAVAGAGTAGSQSSGTGAAASSASHSAAAVALVPTEGRGLFFTLAVGAGMMVGGAALFAQF